MSHWTDFFQYDKCNTGEEEIAHADGLISQRSRAKLVSMYDGMEENNKELPQG
jgi:hypothetical protein